MYQTSRRQQRIVWQRRSKKVRFKLEKLRRNHNWVIGFISIKKNGPVLNGQMVVGVSKIAEKIKVFSKCFKVVCIPSSIAFTYIHIYVHMGVCEYVILQCCCNDIVLHSRSNSVATSITNSSNSSTIEKHKWVQGVHVYIFT